MSRCSNRKGGLRTHPTKLIRKRIRERLQQGFIQKVIIEVPFNKDEFFSILFGGALNLYDLTVYAVVEQTGQERRSYFSNYTNAVNWGYGYHLDLDGGSIRASTSADIQEIYSDWVASGLPVGMHYITTTIDASGEWKSIYCDSSLLSSTTVHGIAFHTTKCRLLLEL